MELYTVKNILEAILLSVDKPMDLRQLDKLFEADEENRPGKEQILQGLQALQADYQGRGMELTEVSSGYRIQVREDYTGWISRLWEEKAPRYSRALLETLVLIAYRQPITRGEIEEIRGVSVSSHIMKTLQERDWVRVLGHKDVPGKPSMYGSTSQFLDYFNLKSLDELPPLSDIQDLDKLHPSLQLEDEQAATEADSTESEATAEVAGEAVSGSENRNESLDAPNDAYEKGAEEADEDLDQKLEQEKLSMPRDSSETTDRDEASDANDRDEALGEAVIKDATGLEEVEVSTEQDDPPTAELTGAAEPGKTLADESEVLQHDTVNSDEADAEDFVTQADATSEQDKPLSFHELADADDRDELLEVVDESGDLDPTLEALTQQDDSSTAEQAEAAESEIMADETLEPEFERDEAEVLVDDAVNSDEQDVEDIADDEDAEFEQGKPLSYHEQSETDDRDETSDVDEDASDLDKRDEFIEQDDVSMADQAEAGEQLTMADDAWEPESEQEAPEEPLDDLVNVDEADARDADVEENPEQEKQVLSYEPSETADLDESQEESPEQDIPPEPERGGWTKLAQKLWERLKKLMQKGRKRMEHDWQLRPV